MSRPEPEPHTHSVMEPHTVSDESITYAVVLTFILTGATVAFFYMAILCWSERYDDCKVMLYYDHAV